MDMQPLRILLIDDDEDDYVMTRALLSDIDEARYDLEWVTNFEAGLEEIQRRNHDVCLLDYRLGERDGLEFLREAIARGSNVPMIVLTGHGGLEIDVEAMKAGATDYLDKEKIDVFVLERSIRHAVERARTLEQIRQSEERYRNLVETARDAIVTLSTDGIITSVNRAVETITGWSSAELIGKPFTSLLHPDDVARNLELLHRVLNGETIPVTGTRILSKSGEFLFMESASSPLIQDGKVVGALAITRDVTQRVRLEQERRKAEEALRESEERYRKFFEEDLTGDYIATADGRLLACNPAFARIFGFHSVEEAMNHNLETLYPNVETREAFLELLRKEKKLEYHEAELRRCDGSSVHVIENAAGTFQENGELLEIKGYLFDITDHKKLEEQLRQSLKMEAIGQLAGGVAHDFNNTLMAIMGYCELLLLKLEPTNPVRHEIREILRATDQGASITQQLLAFSRKQVLEPKVLDLNHILEKVNHMLRRLIREDIELHTHLGAELGLVRADPTQIVQVIMNLVVNARDAMPQGGKLTLETANVALDEEYARHHVSVIPGNYVMLAVSDSGCGMDEETRSRIFEPFFTTKENGKGTGLGLSTVYGIVKQSDGHIWVYSQPGHGSAFKIYLPRVHQTAEAEASSVPLAAPASGWETILLTDDNESLRIALADVLQMHGYTVLPACHGKEALEISREHQGPIHLLITDVVMPEMNGRELVEHIESERPKIKVLYMSGYTENTIHHHGVLDPGVAFLQKPSTMNAILGKIRELLDRK